MVIALSLLNVPSWYQLNIFIETSINPKKINYLNFV